MQEIDQWTGSGDRRGGVRHAVGRRAMIRQPRLRPLAIEVSDITSIGCGFVSACDLSPGARVLLDLPGLEIWPATVVWCDGGRGGMRFCRPMHPAVADHLAA